MVYIAKGMVRAGADGMNFDTSGASGDADFLAALKAVEEIKKEYPDFGVEIGMAGEFVMGMHGKLKYDGKRLAGMYPHQQGKVAEKAGANIFGPVVNTNSNKSFAWNIARAVTMIKALSLIHIYTVSGRRSTMRSCWCSMRITVFRQVRCTSSV